LCTFWLGIVAVQAQPRGRRAIGERIEEMIGADMKSWCEAKGVAYPPEKVLFRVFKMEKEIEIWAMSKGLKSMQFVHTASICDMDWLPGPKLKRGDSKTPEGFYYIKRNDFGTSSKFGFMWMCLDEAGVDDSGESGKCSCVKICLDYPNNVDKARTRRGAGLKDPGDAICVHGNCISDGCVSFENRDFLPVYGFAALHHRRKNDDLQFHIFPFRFKDKELESVAIDPKTEGLLGKEKTLRFWRNLKAGYELFEETKMPLPVRTGIKLKKGSVGRPVKQLQRVLKELGHYAGDVTGLYDDATVEAVKAFQKARKIKQTGRIRKADTDQLQMYWYE